MTPWVNAPLEPDHIAQAERFARGVVLTSGFDYFVAVVHNTELAEPFARRVAACSVTTDGASLIVRWFRWSGLDKELGRLEALLDEHQPERQLIVFDLSLLREPELEAASRFARGLNLRRDALPKALRGSMLVCIPDWLERHFAAAAPDFWSVVISAKLVRGVESFPKEVMDEWWIECDEAFDAHPTLNPGLYKHGTYTFAYAFEPGAVDLAAIKFVEKMREVPQYTGWAVWLVADNDSFVPYPSEGRIECSLADEFPARVDPAHSDFWRAAGTGQLYLRRGYDEDSELAFEPGKIFSASLPIWRLGEAMLHARELGNILGLRDHVRLRVRARWTGLEGRKLDRWPAGPLARVRPAVSQTNEVVAESMIELGQLKADLRAPVSEMTRPLFESFGFYQPTPEVIAHHLDRLVNRR